MWQGAGDIAPWPSLLSRSRRGLRGGLEGVANLQDPSLILREPPNGNPVLYSFWGLTNLTSDTPPYGKDGQPPGGDGGRVKFAQVGANSFLRTLSEVKNGFASPRPETGDQKPHAHELERDLLSDLWDTTSQKFSLIFSL